MSRLYEVEMEREVRSWLAGLTDRDFDREVNWYDHRAFLLRGTRPDAEDER